MGESGEGVGGVERYNAKTLRGPGEGFRKEGFKLEGLRQKGFRQEVLRQEGLGKVNTPRDACRVGDLRDTILHSTPGVEKARLGECGLYFWKA